MVFSGLGQPLPIMLLSWSALAWRSGVPVWRESRCSLYLQILKPDLRGARKKVKRFFQRWQYAAAIAWLCASPLAVANRTGLLATSGSISAFLLYRYKVRAVPFIVAIFFLGIWIVVYMPSFKESTFRGKNVTIQDIQDIDSTEIDSSGRFAMWDYLLKRFYRPHRLTGAGLGTTQQFLYVSAASGRGPFGGLKAAHSEYVYLLCDTGLIGLVLYLLTGISGLFLGLQAVFRRDKNEKILGMVVASSFIALFCAMGFDNVFNYALAAHQYPYAFLGMLLGVSGSRPKRKSCLSPRPFHHCMKILLVHNFYGSSAPSGENSVFISEEKLLRNHGHAVNTFTRHSDEIRGRGIIGTVQGALSVPWNPLSKTQLQNILQREKPDILHVHNFFPLISPSVFSATQNLQTATVLTLHNYRLFCAAGIPLRNNQPCTECLDRRSIIPALQYGCYRNSRIATLPLAMMIELHRRLKTWQNHVDTFIALTHFQKDKMVSAGLPENKVVIKPHFYNDPPLPVTWQERKDNIVYIGRLGEEKGCRIMLQAWQKWGRQAPRLDIIGDGPLRQELEEMSHHLGITDRVSFVGQLPFAETQSRLSQSKLLLLPSLCYEGFPMVIGEAFSLGVPVATSR